MRILIQADSANDQLYIGFGDSNSDQMKAARTVEVLPDVFADLDSGGKLIGIDIVNATTATGQSMDDLAIESLVGVKEAAALMGVRKSNFVRDFANNPDFPRPVVDLASGRVWLRSEIEKYADRRQHRPSRRPRARLRT